MARSAVALFSGGLDSTTVVAIAAAEGFEVHALTVDYGQRHRVEVERARRLARTLPLASHRVQQLDLVLPGSSATHRPRDGRASRS